MSEPTTPTANPIPMPFDARPLIDAGKALGSPLPSLDAGHGRKTEPCVIVPEGYTVLPLALRPELPDRVHAAATFDDVESFCEYVKRFKTPDSMIFANRNTAQVLSILDYHAGDRPAACCHRAALVPSETQEWKVWMMNNNKQMGQEAFARFLEEWATIIHEPDAATMLEVASSLEATKSVRFKSSKRLSDGKREFMYVEDVEGTVTKGAITIPELFKISLRRLRSDYPHQITCRFRWRVSEEGMVLFYQMDRLDLLLDDLADCLERTIKTATDIAPLWVPDVDVVKLAK